MYIYNIKKIFIKMSRSMSTKNKLLFHRFVFLEKQFYKTYLQLKKQKICSENEKQIRVKMMS